MGEGNDRNQAMVFEPVFDAEGNKIGMRDQESGEVVLFNKSVSPEEMRRKSKESADFQAKERGRVDALKEEKNRQKAQEALEMKKIKEAAIARLLPTGKFSKSAMQKGLEYVTESGASFTREEAMVLLGQWTRIGYDPDPATLSPDAKEALRYIKAVATFVPSDGFAYSPEHQAILDQQFAEQRRRAAVQKMEARPKPPEVKKPKPKQGFIARLFERK